MASVVAKASHAAAIGRPFGPIDRFAPAASCGRQVRRVLHGLQRPRSRSAVGRLDRLVFGMSVMDPVSAITMPAEEPAGSRWDDFGTFRPARRSSTLPNISRFALPQAGLAMTGTRLDSCDRCRLLFAASRHLAPCPGDPVCRIDEPNPPMPAIRLQTSEARERPSGTLQKTWRSRSASVTGSASRAAGSLVAQSRQALTSLPKSLPETVRSAATALY